MTDALPGAKPAGRSPGHFYLQGFSLLELAISMAVVTTVLLVVIVPYTTQLTQRNVRDTQKILDDTKDALLVFAMTRSRLPCPASATSAGLESFAAGGDETNGLCSNFFDGFLPAATLGMYPNVAGYAVDAFGGQPANRIRYAVSNQAINGVTSPFTRTNGMRAATMPAIGASTMTLLFVCESGSGVVAGTSCGLAAKLTDTAPVVLWSSGSNAATSGGVSVDELQNPSIRGGSADRIFVSRPQSNREGAEFDDVVTWIPLGILLGRLVSVGQLP